MNREMLRDFWIKRIKDVNGKRRTRIVSLEEIEDKVEHEIRHYRGLKKYLKYLTISNYISLPNSYTDIAYYTKWVVTLTEKGKIKKISVYEERCKNEAYGRCGIRVSIDKENIEQITGLDLSKANEKCINVLEKAILAREI